MVYLNKPTTAIGSNDTAQKYSASISFEIECPVVGKPTPVLEPEYEYTVTDGGKYYDHCKSCSIGVYLAPKESNDIRCTYCGKTKNVAESNQ
jgi:hypothetical protein